MLPTQEEALKLVMAVFIGALIGAEREYRDKAAGFRTMTLICVGACLFTQASLSMGGSTMRDPARIAAQIVTGVGFLGGGVIMRDGGKVTGITTAATIWLTAALGMGIGGGFYGVTFLAAAVVLLTLWILPFIERRIDARTEERDYRLTCAQGSDHAVLAEVLVGSGLRLHDHHRMKLKGCLVLMWSAKGPPAAHERACDTLLGHASVEEFTC
jgi:putative Mg2+ transporter-C (MgtC) family protein